MIFIGSNIPIYLLIIIGSSIPIYVTSLSVFHTEANSEQTYSGGEFCILFN